MPVVLHSLQYLKQLEIVIYVFKQTQYPETLSRRLTVWVKFKNRNTQRQFRRSFVVYMN